MTLCFKLILQKKFKKLYRLDKGEYVWRNGSQNKNEYI